MSNFASQFKVEIQRIVRKELRVELAPLRKAVAAHRTDIAALKRRVSSLESAAKKLGKAVVARPGPADASTVPTSSLRWSAAGFAALRKRLNLSATDMGLLVGVSNASVYQWEAETTSPRSAQLQKIAIVRKMGKREAAQALLAAKEALGK